MKIIIITKKIKSFYSLANQIYLLYFIIIFIFSAGIVLSQPDFTQLSRFGIGISRSSDWGDFDNDGDPDLAVGNLGQNYLYINDGEGNFTEIADFGNLPTNFVKWLDVDTDGDLDLVVGNNEDNPNFFYYNQGGGNFIELEFFDPINMTDIGGGDFDDDGDLDLVIACWGDGSYLLNNTGSNYVLWASFCDAISVAVFDVDNDTDEDIVLGAGCCIDSSEVYKNDGNGSFSLFSRFGSENAEMSEISQSDVDNDGDIDIIANTGGSEGMIYIYENDGNGNFISSVVVDTIYFSSVEFGDIDGDSDPDVVVGSFGWYSDRLAVYFNNDMVFSKSVIETGGGTDLPLEVIKDIELCDFDNDGDLDISVMRFLWASEFEVEEVQNSLYLNNISQDINKYEIYQHKITIYPNPFRNTTTIKINQQIINSEMKLSIAITDIIGNELIQIDKIKTNTIEINRSNLPSGIYILKLKNKKEIIAISKLIIQ